MAEASGPPGSGASHVHLAPTSGGPLAPGPHLTSREGADGRAEHCLRSFVNLVNFSLSSFAAPPSPCKLPMNSLSRSAALFSRRVQGTPHVR